MGQVGLEPVLVPQPLRHPFERRRSDLGLGAAETADQVAMGMRIRAVPARDPVVEVGPRDRNSTRLNSSHQIISYAVFCLKKKKIDSLPLVYFCADSVLVLGIAAR